jgi:DNA-binding response OmpR family regulator
METKNMKSVLLVFDESAELDFIDSNLCENGFLVYKSSNLNDALVVAEKKIPNLIVINTFDSEVEINRFTKQIKTERLKNVNLLSLIELEDYLKTSTKEHFVVKPVRPKLLLSLIRSVMNHEEINWFPAFH